MQFSAGTQLQNSLISLEHASNLIGKGLDGRKLVAKTVNGLYGRRSKIVHTGAYGVSRRESALLHFYCMSALGMLVVSPAFAGFSTSTELEDWFKDRMLDGPNHLEQESETAAVEIAPVS